jgi:hypothetical protein
MDAYKWSQHATLPALLVRPMAYSTPFSGPYLKFSKGELVAGTVAFLRGQLQHAVHKDDSKESLQHLNETMALLCESFDANGCHGFKGHTDGYFWNTEFLTDPCNDKGDPRGNPIPLPVEVAMGEVVKSLPMKLCDYQLLLSLRDSMFPSPLAFQRRYVPDFALWLIGTISVNQAVAPAHTNFFRLLHSLEPVCRFGSLDDKHRSHAETKHQAKVQWPQRHTASHVSLAYARFIIKRILDNWDWDVVLRGRHE